MDNSTVKAAPLIVELLDSVLDILPDGIYISDSTGQTLMINLMYEKLTGLKRAELLGRNVNDLTREGVFDVVLNPEIVATGRPATRVQTNRHGRRLVLNGFPIFDDKGGVALVVTFARDITLMTQMREQIDQQRELIEKYHKTFDYLNREQARLSGFVAQNREMMRLLEQLKRISATDATILLLGETGVGKDVFARKVHEHSPRHDRPFFKVDCASIPENLIESELFGYAPGAFSGALAKGKIGFFEMADKGTLFLDEIGELPLTMQAKLLRFLQDQEVVRVGSTQARRVDVRIIAATNRDLGEELKRGNFRSDLYYRLRVAVLTIPALRERPDDIIPLAGFFLDKYATQFRKKMLFSVEIEEAFRHHKWPGNVRELENLVQSLVISGEKEVIGLDELPASMIDGQGLSNVKISLGSRVTNPEGASLKEIMAELEREVIHNALEHHGSITKVARLLKVDRTTIFRKLRRQQ